MTLYTPLSTQKQSNPGLHNPLRTLTLLSNQCVQAQGQWQLSYDRKAYSMYM